MMVRNSGGTVSNRLPVVDWMRTPEVLAVLDALEAIGAEARFVGGAVRDLAMGRMRPDADIDIATTAEPEDVTNALKAAGLSAVPTGLDHGTITAVSGGRGFEITTLRRDVSTDGRRATVAFTTDWREDAARRDFTVNAMSLTRDGGLYDYFDGMRDAQAGRIRFVGDPDRRIAEDVLRVFRFFRFQAVMGREDPSADALKACRLARDRLSILSAERVWTELRKLLTAEDPDSVIQLMRDAECLDHWLPEAVHPPLFKTSAIGVCDPIQRLALVAGIAVSGNSGAAETIATRLKLSNSDRNRLVCFVDPPIKPGQEKLPRTQGLYALGAAFAREVAALGVAVDPRAWEPVLVDAQRWGDPVFPIAGADVVAAGLTPGPEIGRILNEVQSWWLVRDGVPDRTACLEQLAKLLSK